LYIQNRPIPKSALFQGHGTCENVHLIFLCLRGSN
jgi:hypothetical protein